MASPKTMFHECGLIDDQSSKLSFRVGAPGPHLLKKSAYLFKKTSQQFIKYVVDDPYVLQYGPMLGCTSFRQELAKFLAHQYSDHVDYHNLVITSGATDGLQMILTTMLNSGANVYTEDPTYFLAPAILQQAGMNVIPVLTENDGINVNELESLLLNTQNSTSVRPLSLGASYAGMIYLIPIFNNPRGFCLAEEKCKKIVELACQYNLLIFCDDVYNLICFDGSVPKRLLSYARCGPEDFNDHVISNGSFSKLVGPGVRLGWLEMSKSLVSRMTTYSITDSSGGKSFFMSAMVCAILQSETMFAQYLKELRMELKNNVYAMCQVLEAKAPGVSFIKPKGGNFLWIMMPPKASAAIVVDMLSNRFNITSAPGQIASPSGKFTNCMRLAFNYYPREQLASMTEKLCIVINEYLSSLK